MRTPVELARLTEAHRLAQARLASVVSRSMLSAWPLLDRADLDGSMARWLDATVPMVTGQNTVSARLSMAYLDAFKKAALGADAVVDLVELVGLPVEQAVTSLTVTGPVSVKQGLSRGVALDAAMDAARVASSRSASRLVLQGGRDVIVGTMRREGVGWARVTSGSPCRFCAMLASRGAVYGADSARFHAHDGCHCSAQPDYEGAGVPASSQHWADLWAEAASSEGDTLAVFGQLVGS